MFSKKMEKALNDQVNAEMYASYLYLSMSAYFTSVNLNGFANWMMAQHHEEIFHAMKIYDFINERDGKVILQKIDAPKTAWKSPTDVFQDALEHEKKVTTMINNLVEMSTNEKDFATHSFLHWFIDEQVEEEASVKEIIDKLEFVGEKGAALYMLDKEHGTRTITPLANGE
jgi:ferritin